MIALRIAMLFMSGIVLLSASLLRANILLIGVDRLDTPDYSRSIAKWQSERETRLKAPDGWLNLAGLYWLQAGVTSIGSAPENNIRLAKELAPPSLGEFLVEGEAVTFLSEPGVEVLSDGIPITRLRLVHDEAGEPTHLSHGRLGWHMIRRMERLGVRLRDYEHAAVTAFEGIDFYPVDPAWRVAAQFDAYAEPRKPMLTTVVEELGWNPTAPGTLEFELAGQALSLEAYDLGDRFFLIFADLTTGKTTYPSGRYLYADAPGADGITILDFNKAHSPPCAFTSFATCPLPSRQNRMKVAIEAGEKYDKGK